MMKVKRKVSLQVLCKMVRLIYCCTVHIYITGSDMK